ncbi:hypothetical protein FA10DRAFT_299465 [Acaromyces ingoldii]|uniref:Cytochrome c oxidase assembly protein COX20, mitochondrial n=1 Tax=Acaromyces ingoldii TaxID=215250 RepID=A0A316Z1T8_9BASI|nr:hypothetical protein FA10DRAFT_299465 [Acaromyces ingoldii]PWN94155.1 hypothetical protein FA10DRAFT_299465 [Acaromyces ingoldii]
MATTIDAPDRIGKDNTLTAKLAGLDPLDAARRLGDGRVPCARSSLLLGMGTAGAVAGVGLVARRGMLRSANWGVGAFVFVSLVSWHTCRSARRQEAKRMKVIVEDFQKKRGERAAAAGEGR